MIIYKQGNENAKVSEIIFINTLNAEGLNSQLQEQLNEVENRIEAGWQRRQERLNEITCNNKNKNSKKGCCFLSINFCFILKFYDILYYYHSIFC